MSAYNPLSFRVSEACPPHNPLELPRLHAARSRSQSSAAVYSAQAGKPFTNQPQTARAPDPESPLASPLPSASHSSPLLETEAGGSLPGRAIDRAQVAEGGSAIDDVLACRLEQIERWGHTPEKDRERPLQGFLVDVESYARAAREDLQYREGADRVRKRLVKLAALTLAAIDRVDMEPGDD